MVYGYKCFNKDMTNVYGCLFEIGNSYCIDGEVKFGINSNGYHMCSSLVDVFRYYDTSNNNFMVCLVKGDGNVLRYDDEYNGFYDMYVVSSIEIVRNLSREEIIDMVMKMNEFNIIRFIQLFKLNKNEIDMFLEKFNKNIDIVLAIKYYQIGDVNVYLEYYNERYKKKVRGINEK